MQPTVEQVRRGLGMLLWIVLIAPAQAEHSRQIVTQSDPLVQKLEALYQRSMEVAERGDLETYWTMRTAASKARPPYLTPQLLPIFARMLPPLSGLPFVRMDATSDAARALYRWRQSPDARYTIIVYRREQGSWKIDSVAVKTDVSGIAPPVKPSPDTPPRRPHRTNQ
ncbi:MAG: hypothetical protein ABI612_01405 [Betaproteobacteria bacterium]